MKEPGNKSHRPTCPSGHSEGTRLLETRRVAIAAVALLCLCIAVFFIVRSLRRGETGPAKQRLESEFVEKELDIEESAKAYNERAVDVAQRLIEEFPGRPEPMFLLGHVHYEQEDYDQAAKVWEEALKIDSLGPDAYQSLGLIALQGGDYEAAISHWRRAVEVEPGWPGARLAIGLALMHLGRIDEAVPEFEAELKLSETSAQAHFLLAQALFQLNRLEEAKNHYESAVEYNPRFTSAYYGLSRTLMRLGQKEAAKEPLERFQSLKAGEGKTKRKGMDAYDDIVFQRGALGRTYDRAGMIYRLYGKVRKAMDHFQIAARLDPLNTPSRFHLADLYERQGQIKEAIGVYEEMSRVNPRDVRPYVPLGNLYAREGRFADAEESFKRVIQFAPRHPRGYRELASLYFETKVKLNMAEALAREALDLEPSAANYDLLGWACYLNGKFAEAEAAAKKATELDPDNRIYKDHYETIQAKL